MIVSCSLQKASERKQEKQKAEGLSFTVFTLPASGQQTFASLASSVHYELNWRVMTALQSFFFFFLLSSELGLDSVCLELLQLLLELDVCGLQED